MTRVPNAGSRAGAGNANGRQRSTREVMDALEEIAASEEPAVVMSSLARSSTPSFSDGCAIELSEGTETLFRVCFPAADEADLYSDARQDPAADSAPPVETRSVITTFDAPAGNGYPSFAGIAVHFWTGRDPTEDDAIIARLLVDRAVAVVQHERLTQAAARADSRAARLAIDLITSRIEGEATGILMAQHHVTRAQAASLLRQASQERQRKLHEVAAGVVHGRDRDELVQPDVGSRERPVDLHMVSSHTHPADGIR